LPENLKVDFLFIHNCPKLTELPKKLDAGVIDWDKEKK
jgi:hypothetical protein